MTATGNEAVSLAQLKDYADNQSSGGGDEYTYLNTMLTSLPSTHGGFKMQALSNYAYGDAYVALCFNANELILECASSTVSKSLGISITSDTGQIHCLACANSNSESYPVYLGVPYVAYENSGTSGVTVLTVSKSENTITIDGGLTLGGASVVLSPRLRFYLTDE